VAGHPWGPVPGKPYIGKARRNVARALPPRHPNLFTN
jgi:hypothetical protein